MHADREGSVAAPTAGLHFTTKHWARLGEAHELVKWCTTQCEVRRKGLLPEKRVLYLEGIGFEF